MFTLLILAAMSCSAGTLDSKVYTNVKALQNEIKDLKLNTIVKDQNIMNLRSILGQKSD